MMGFFAGILYAGSGLIAAVNLWLFAIIMSTYLNYYKGMRQNIKSNHSKGNNETTQIDLTYIILYTVIHIILPAIFSYKMLQIAYYALDEGILNDGIYRK